MHTFSASSLNIHHDRDGDFQNPFYLVDNNGTSIVTTMSRLIESLSEPRDIVFLTGPDSEHHDRHDITELVDGKITFCVADYVVTTARVDKGDVMAFIGQELSDIIVSHLEQIGNEDDHSGTMLKQMSAIATSLAVMRGQDQPEIAAAIEEQLQFKQESV